MSIPAFENGALPPGEFEVTVDELEASYLVTGHGLNREDWHVAHRAKLVQNLRRVSELLRLTGMVSALYVNGSFVQLVDSPSDVDCYFVLHDELLWDDGHLQSRLRDLDPDGGWDWTTLKRCGAKTRKPLFWCRYRVDLVPELGGPSGIWGRDGSLLTYTEAFQQRTDTGAPKGVLRISFLDPHSSDSR